MRKYSRNFENLPVALCRTMPLWRFSVLGESPLLALASPVPAMLERAEGNAVLAADEFFLGLRPSHG